MDFKVQRLQNETICLQNVQRCRKPAVEVKARQDCVLGTEGTLSSI